MFRKEVMINFSDPFSIRELKELYNSNPAKGLLAFNERVETALKREVIIVEDKSNDWLAEELLVMGRNNLILPFFKWMFNSDQRRQLEKDITDKINLLAKTSKEKFDSLSDKVKNYSSLLKKNHIKDENIARKLDWGFIRYLSVFIGLPFFLAGYIANLIPYTVPRLICKTQIKDLRFYSSVYIGIGTVLYLIYFPVVLILLAVFAGWPGFLFGLVIPLLGYLVLFYKEVTNERFYTFLFWWKKLNNPSMVTELVSLRKEILNDLDKVDLKSA
jgi:hypothetical protein